MKGDQSVSFRTESGRILKTQVEIQLGLFPLSIIPLFAGNLTCPAADTSGDID
jgi:hypothetical protein